MDEDQHAQAKLGEGVERVQIAGTAAPEGYELPFYDCPLLLHFISSTRHVLQHLGKDITTALPLLTTTTHLDDPLAAFDLS